MAQTSVHCIFMYVLLSGKLTFGLLCTLEHSHFQLFMYLLPIICLSKQDFTAFQVHNTIKGNDSEYLNRLGTLFSF